MMAPLIANSNTCPSRSTTPSTPPSNLRMPHVFVIPPEEEQQDNPPWCCFDADDSPENSGDSPSNPDIDFLEDSYLFHQSEQDVPPIARTSVHHPRPRATISKKLEKIQRPEAVKIIENKLSRARHRDGREDSDVIEVVKVKRTRETLTDLEENTKVKRSKTLKARATRALHSIKNVGKGSHRTHVKEIWTSSEGMPEIFKGMQTQTRSHRDETENRPPATATSKGSLSRRSLSQFFQFTKSSRSNGSFAVYTAPPVPLAEADHSLPAAEPTSLPHFRYSNTNTSLNNVPSTLTIDDAPNRPAFSTPSIKKNAKFSVRELHRLFSFSSSPPAGPSSVPTTTTEPSLSALRGSMPSASTTTLSSSFDYIDVTVEEDIFADAHVLDLDSPDRKFASRYREGFRTHRDDNFSSPRRLSDLSFEMRLDSLHFDTLSFDAGDFDVSMEGNILR